MVAPTASATRPWRGSSRPSTSPRCPFKRGDMSASTPDDPYRILNVPHTASDREVTLAYRALARAHHPDKNGGVDSPFFIQVNLSYEVLSDVLTRSAYDRRYGHGGARRDTTSSGNYDAGAASAARAAHGQPGQHSQHSQQGHQGHQGQHDCGGGGGGSGGGGGYSGTPEREAGGGVESAAFAKMERLMERLRQTRASARKVEIIVTMQEKLERLKRRWAGNSSSTSSVASASTSSPSPSRLPLPPAAASSSSAPSYARLSSTPRGDRGRLARLGERLVQSSRDPAKHRPGLQDGGGGGGGEEEEGTFGYRRDVEEGGAHREQGVLHKSMHHHNQQQQQQQRHRRPELQDYHEAAREQDNRAKAQGMVSIGQLLNVWHAESPARRGRVGGAGDAPRSNRSMAGSAGSPDWTDRSEQSCSPYIDAPTAIYDGSAYLRSPTVPGRAAIGARSRGGGEGRVGRVEEGTGQGTGQSMGRGTGQGMASERGKEGKDLGRMLDALGAQMDSERATGLRRDGNSSHHLVCSRETIIPLFHPTTPVLFFEWRVQPASATAILGGRAGTRAGGKERPADFETATRLQVIQHRGLRTTAGGTGGGRPVLCAVAEVFAVHTKPSLRHRGHCTACLEACARHLFRAGFDVALLSCAQALVPLYAGCGYRMVGGGAAAVQGVFGIRVSVAPHGAVMALLPLGSVSSSACTWEDQLFAQ